MKITKENIWEEVQHSNLEVLKSPLCYELKDERGWTPLHGFCNSGLFRDKVEEVLKHPMIDKVFDVLHGEEWTPLHVLVANDKLFLDDLKKLYPWYDFKRYASASVSVLNDVLSTPNSVRFIKENE